MRLLRGGEPLVPRGPVPTIEAPPVRHLVEALVRVLEGEERGQPALEDSRVVAARPRLEVALALRTLAPHEAARVPRQLQVDDRRAPPHARPPLPRRASARISVTMEKINRR